MAYRVEEEIDERTCVSGIEQWAEGFAATPWIYVITFTFTFIDGFFPPFPSETLVIGLTSFWRSTGQPIMPLVVGIAAVGAFGGDQVAYQIGRMVTVSKLPLFANSRGRRVLRWAEHALQHRGASFIIAARYIPIGRVAVNLTAGALRYPRARFIAIDAVASVLWAIYSGLIGLVAGAVVGDNALLGVGIGVGLGIALGYLVDWVLQRFGGLRIEPLDESAPDVPSEPVDALPAADEDSGPARG
jgi:membrane-associated protein